MPVAAAGRIYSDVQLCRAPRRPPRRRWPAWPALFPCFFLLGNVAARYTGNVGIQLVLYAAVSVVVFAGCPLLFAAAQRVRLVEGFQLRQAPLLGFLGAAVLGCALWPFAYELFLVGKLTGLATLNRDQFGEIERLLQAFRGLSPALVLLTLSVVQPVCEEFFFRGYLFHGLRDRFQGASVIIVSSLLFGLFHVLNPATLTPERFLPSTFLGLFLGWICYRTGSVAAGNGTARDPQRPAAVDRSVSGFDHRARLGPGGT